MTTWKYLVRGATLPSKSLRWAINNPQPSEKGSRGQFAVRVSADVQAQLAEPKSSLLFEKLLRFALILYAAQATIGFSVGFVLPWLFYFGVMHR